MSGSKKYSISLPEDLAESVRVHVGPGGLSTYLADALEQRVAVTPLPHRKKAGFQPEGCGPARTDPLRDGQNLPAMDKLREIVVDFEIDNDELTRDEVEAARALLRHEHHKAGGAAFTGIVR